MTVTEELSSHIFVSGEFKTLNKLSFCFCDLHLFIFAMLLIETENLKINSFKINENKPVIYYKNVLVEGNNYIFQNKIGKRRI